MDTQYTNNDNDISSMETKGGGGFGPIVGILIIVALMAFGGLYFWGTHLMNLDDTSVDNGPTSFEVTSTTVEDGGTMTDAEFEALFNEATPSDTAINSLDSAIDDLSDLDNIDAELDALGSEL